MDMVKKDDFEHLKQLYVDSRTGSVPSSLLLSGREEYPLLSYIRQLKSIVPMPEMNIVELRDVFRYENVKHSFDILPVMSEFRLVILNKTGYFKWNKDERFHSLFSDIPEHIRLVVFEEDLNKTSSNYKKFEKKALKIVLEKANKKYLVSWIKTKFQEAVRSYGEDCLSRITNEAVYRLADYGVEKGMFCIKNAIDRLVAENREIHVEDIESYMGAEQKNTVWALYENITGRRFMETLISLIEDGEDEFELFGRISSVLRGGLKYRIGCYEGTPYMTKIASMVAATFDEERLHHLVRELSNTDMDMKSTAASKKNLLIQLAMNIEAARNSDA